MTTGSLSKAFVQGTAPPGLLAKPDMAAAATGSPALRRRADPLAMTGSLTATFVGLLVVHALGFAGIAEAAPLGAPAGDGGEARPAAGPSPADGLPGTGAIGDAPLPAAAGSVLAAGTLIDAGALTSLSGGVHFADGYTSPSLIASAGVGGPLVQMASAEAAAAPVTISLGGMGAIKLPTLTEPGSGEPDHGSIGGTQQGADGNDVLTGTDKNDTISGGGGDDVIHGAGGDDQLSGDAGNDEIHGDAGNDTLAGGTGDDTLDGGAGNDGLDGGAGNDVLLGGTGNDVLGGGSGNDTLDGQSGENELSGGTGDDVLVVHSIHDLALENPFGQDGGGVDTIVVTDDYADSLKHDLPKLAPQGLATFALGQTLGEPLPDGVNGYRQQVQPDIENIRLDGTSAHDVVGDDRANIIIGNDGDNALYGGGGDDHIAGGAGNDWLGGGAGDDFLYGGAGDDVFMIGLHESGTETIFDHEGVNLLRVDAGDGDLLAAHLEGGDLVLTDNGSGVAIIKDYGSDPGAFAGVDTGHGVTSFDDLLAPPVAGAPADILGPFMDAGGTTTPAAQAAASMSSAPADAPSAAAPAMTPGGDAGFMTAHDLWLPPSSADLVVVEDPAPKGTDATGHDGHHAHKAAV
jgi:Ca2+-binding RTX toxin-like protein